MRGLVARSPVVLVVLVVLVLPALAGSAARAEVCLPPAFGEQPRLLQRGEVEVLWLELLLRQHDVCWRVARSTGEKRIFVYGNSVLFGFPYASEDSAVGLVNRELERRNVPAHFFNLGFSYPSQLKEALIINESLRFEPDAIVYGLILNDLMHSAMPKYVPLREFFDSNSTAVERLANSAPATLDVPSRIYRDFQAEDVRPQAAWRSLREIGKFVRVRARDAARSIRRIWFPDFSNEYHPIIAKRAQYDCAEVTEQFRLNYQNWQDWSVLDYLAKLQRTRGIEVLIVSLPERKQPQDGCFNARYPAADYREYTEWLEQKTEALGLAFLDLHDRLIGKDFVDSVHPSARGQRKVAAALLNRFLAGSPTGVDTR